MNFIKKFAKEIFETINFEKRLVTALCIENPSSKKTQQAVEFSRIRPH